MKTITELKRELEALRQARNAEIVRLRGEGQTLQSIGDTFGITRERVRQIIRDNRDRQPA